MDLPYSSADPNKIGVFCLQQARIPSNVLTEIMSTIDYNAVVNNGTTLTKSVEDIQAKDEAAGNDKKLGTLPVDARIESFAQRD